MEWSGPGKDTGPGYLRKNILQNKLGDMFGYKLGDMHEYMMGDMRRHGMEIMRYVLKYIHDIFRIFNKKNKPNKNNKNFVQLR